MHDDSEWGTLELSHVDLQGQLPENGEKILSLLLRRLWQERERERERATPRHFFLKKKEGRKEKEGREERKAGRQAGRKEGSGREGERGEEGTTKPKVLLARVARHGEVKALWLDMGSRSS